jgi:hypothetical protein
MNPARVIYENAPAFIPVPAHLQHHRVEAIFWPLDEPSVAVQPPLHAAANVVAVNPGLSPLSKLVGKAKGCFDDAASVDAFIRAGRDEWER